jgi:membrane-associated phospholipid phosphatase
MLVSPLRPRAMGAGLVIVLALAAGTAWPQEPAPSPAPATPATAPSPTPSPAAPEPEKPKGPIVVRDHRTIRSFPANLGHNMVEVWTHPSVKPLLIGSAVTALSFTLDHSTIRFFERHPMQTYGDVGRVLGTGAVAAAVSAGVLGVGRYANGDRFRAATYDMSQAVVVNFLYTLAIKEVVRRPRPDLSDKMSFPSGHASNAFACAQVWVEQYGWKAAVPGYLAAGLVAGSRLALKKHNMSDVVAGGTLGIIVGKSVARWDAKPSHKLLPGETAPPKVTFAPDSGPDGTGIGLGVIVRF